MMTLLLSSCSGEESGMAQAEEEALSIRTEYIAMQSCALQAAITADYGQRVYEFELTGTLTGEEWVLTLTAPETVAGVTARLREGENLLEYDGTILETGELNEDGLSPVSAIPALLEEVRSGFITACALEVLDGRETIRVTCGPAEEGAAQVTEYGLWFDRESHALVQGEILVDGLRVILCRFQPVSPG